MAIRVGIVGQIDRVLMRDGVFLDVAQDAEDLMAIEVDDGVDRLALRAYRRLHVFTPSSAVPARPLPKQQGAAPSVGSGTGNYSRCTPSGSIAKVGYLPLHGGLRAGSRNHVGLTALGEPAPVPRGGRELAVEDYELGPARRIEGAPHDLPGRVWI